ncbi:hypothetical protein Plhal710r2_c060g0169721 [Plasmopara halstedii]
MGCCAPRAEEALTLCVCVTVNSSTDYSEYIFMVSALDIHDVKYPLSACSMLLDCCG